MSQQWNPPTVGPTVPGGPAPAGPTWQAGHVDAGKPGRPFYKKKRWWAVGAVAVVVVASVAGGGTNDDNNSDDASSGTFDSLLEGPDPTALSDVANPTEQTTANADAAVDATPVTETTPVAETTPVTEAASGEAADVTAVTCSTEKDVIGFQYATLTVTNTSSEPSDYMISIVAESPDGTVRYDTTFTTVSALKPGQTVTDQALPFTEELLDGAVCTASEVSRTATRFDEGEMADVTSVACGSADALGFVYATVTATNSSSKPSTYLISVAAESADGSIRYDDSFVTIDALEPGQTTSVEGLPFTSDLPADARCVATEVDRFES